MDNLYQLRNVGVRIVLTIAICIGILITVSGCPTPQPPDDNGDTTIIRPVVGIAPGLNVELIDLIIPTDRRPEIDFLPTDDHGNPIPIAELTDARFILAFLE